MRKIYRDIVNGDIIGAGYEQDTVDPRLLSMGSKMILRKRGYDLSDNGVELVDFLEEALRAIDVNDVGFLKFLLENKIIEEAGESDDGVLYSTQVSYSEFYTDELESALLDYAYEDELSACMKIAEYTGIVFMPLYLYEHSGLSVSTHPFLCKWDSGLCGVIWGDCKDNLKEEVKMLDDYLIGNVMYIAKYDEDGMEVDYVGGVYGLDIDDKNAIINESEGFFGTSVNYDDWEEVERVEKVVYSFKKL